MQKIKPMAIGDMDLVLHIASLKVSVNPEAHYAGKHGM